MLYFINSRSVPLFNLSVISSPLCRLWCYWLARSWSYSGVCGKTMSLSSYRRVVWETARLSRALSQSLIKSTRAAHQVYFHLFSSFQTKTLFIFFFAFKPVCLQGSWKTEAVCFRPPLWKAASRVPPWAWPHRHHSRTGQKTARLHFLHQNKPFSYTDCGVTKQPEVIRFQCCFPASSVEVGGVKTLYSLTCNKRQFYISVSDTRRQWCSTQMHFTHKHFLLQRNHLILFTLCSKLVWVSHWRNHGRSDLIAFLRSLLLQFIFTEH